MLQHTPMSDSQKCFLFFYLFTVVQTFLVCLHHYHSPPCLEFILCSLNLSEISVSGNKFDFRGSHTITCPASGNNLSTDLSNRLSGHF